MKLKAVYYNEKVKQFVQDNIEYVVKDTNKVSAYLFKKFDLVVSKKIKEKIDDINFILTDYIEFICDYGIAKSMVGVNPILSLLKAYHFYSGYDLLNRCQITQISFDDKENLYTIKAKYIGLMIGKYGTLLNNVLNLLNKSNVDAKVLIKFDERKS